MAAPSWPSGTCRLSRVSRRKPNLQEERLTTNESGRRASSTRCIVSQFLSDQRARKSVAAVLKVASESRAGEYCSVPAEYREEVVNFASTRATRLRALYLQGNV